MLSLVQSSPSTLISSPKAHCNRQPNLVKMLSMVILLGIFALPSMAATPCATVTSTDDSSSAATTSGTLRYAIAQANGTIGTACDTITFSLTYPATITIGQNQPYFEISNTTTPITITGPGAANLTIGGDSVGGGNVFQIDSGATATISEVTMGNVTGDVPAAIQNIGTLTLTNSTISNNQVTSPGTANGAGISNIGTLTVTNSTFSGNSNNSDVSLGGALFNTGTATVTNSTFSGNFAYYAVGGGIYNNGVLYLSASTFSGNSTGNSTGGGGAIFNNTSGTLVIKSTILANSPFGGNCAVSSGATIVSDGYNLSDDLSCTSFLNQGTDINNTSGTNNNFAGLDPNGLQNNSGPTPTIALLPTSPAIDKIPIPCTDANGKTISTDQRGVSRPQGPACDIGAFELAAGTYNAFVQQPINPDKSSVFNANKGVVPAKFTLTLNNVATCSLPQASIGLTRTQGGTPGPIDESTYSMAADTGSYYRIDSSACQYIYNINSKALGVGTYRVDVIINGNVVGSGYFALK